MFRKLLVLLLALGMVGFAGVGIVGCDEVVEVVYYDYGYGYYSDPYYDPYYGTAYVYYEDCYDWWGGC